MPATPTKTGLTAWRSFLEAHAAVLTLLEHELDAERQLPLAWYDVLLQLSEAPGGRLRMQDLASRILLSKSGLTRLADRMQKQGLLTRRPCSEDGRGIEATLTPAGRATLKSAAPVHLRGVQRHFASLLSDEESPVLTRVMEKIRDAAYGEVKDVS